MRALCALAVGASVLAAHVHPAVGAQTAQRVWIVHGSDPRVLEHTVRETDDRDFYASCRPRSGTIGIVLTQTIAGLDRRSHVAVAIAANTWRQRYAATTMMNDEYAVFVPLLTIASSDGLTRAMTRERALRIAIGGRTTYVVSLAGSAAAVRSFLAACASGA